MAVLHKTTIKMGLYLENKFFKFQTVGDTGCKLTDRER